MVTLNCYYTYAYLREDGTPYYIGKGKGKRAYNRYGRSGATPPTRDRILILKKNLTEKEAFRHEVYMIAVLGRKDLGTGILRNLSDGGDGCTSGWVPSEETRQKISKSMRGKNTQPKSVEHRKKISNALKGRKPRAWTDEEREKVSLARKGIKTQPCSEETKRKISEANRRRNAKRPPVKWYNLENHEERQFVSGEQPEGWELGRKKKVRLSALA
jgi:hypothetical protein